MLTTVKPEPQPIPCAVGECGGTGAIPAAWMGVPMCIICRAAKEATP